MKLDYGSPEDGVERDIPDKGDDKGFATEVWGLKEV